MIPQFGSKWRLIQRQQCQTLQLKFCRCSKQIQCLFVVLNLHSWRQIKQEVNQCRGGFITSGDLSKRITGVLFSKKKTYFSILKNDFSIQINEFSIQRNKTCFSTQTNISLYRELISLYRELISLYRKMISPCREFDIFDGLGFPQTAYKMFFS